MSQSNIIRFPRPSTTSGDNNPDEANAARDRIAELPNTYLAHAAPDKESLVSAVTPSSPAADVVAGIPISEGEAVIEPTPMPKSRAKKKAAGESDPEDSPRGKYRLPSRLKPLVTGVVTFILLFLVFKAPIFLSQLNYLTQPKTATTTQGDQAAALVPPAPIINIPKINVNAPVVYATSNDEGAILTDLQTGVVHYANTSAPGQPGNSVIFGHSSNDWWEAGNYKFVFVLLDKLVAGDTFTVNYNSHQYVYQVTSAEVVDPTDVAVLNQTADAEMTLITCTPPGTSWKRLVVHSKQISPAATTAAAPSSKSVGGSGTLPSNSPSFTDKIGQWWSDLGHFFGLGGASTPTAPASNPGVTTIPATQ